MDCSVYNYSLCIALPLMVFFGIYFLFARTPEKDIFKNYLRSRRVMGVALLMLAANYSMHFFFGVRFWNVHAAILMNLSTYFLCYWLFSSALMTLLDRFYITRRRLCVHLGEWVLFSLFSGVVLFLLPDGRWQGTGLFVMATWLVCYGLFLATRLLGTYYKAVRVFNDTHSDYMGLYIRWMSVFTYWAAIFGVGCGLLTFLPDDWVFVWILSSVPFYVYLFWCYQNYLLSYEQVENAMGNEVSPQEEASCESKQECVRNTPAFQAGVAEQVEKWIASDGYVRSGLTLKELSDYLHTNRTYLSAYINDTYGVSFREWITGLRIDYAKRVITQYPEQTIADIAERSGFQSASHFIRLFKENTGFSPAKWRKQEVE